MKKDIILDSWQEDILKAKGNVLLCTGRQVGKTTIFAMKAAKRMIEKPNTTIITVSLTEDQAKLIIVMVLDYLEKHNLKEIRKGRNKPTQNIIKLKNGSMIRARPVGMTGDALRGFTGDILYIDEAARMPKLVWAAAKPTLLTTAGEIWMSSTPFGKEGYFYESYINKDKRWTVFHISSEKVIHERPISVGWTQIQREAAIEFLQSEKRDMSELQYGQEYLGLFLDELRQYFSDELIEKACILKREEVGRRGDFYLGCDLARMGGDEITYEVLKKINNENIQHVDNIVKKMQLTTQTEQDILYLDKIYDFQKIYLDAGAGTLGVSIFDHLLKDDQTKRKVVAINNKQRSLDKDEKTRQRLMKEDLYDNLRSLMEKQHIKLLNDEDLRMSLKSVQYEYITNDKGLSRMRIFGNYTHIVEGLIRAAWCAKEKELNIWISSIRI